MHGRGTGVHRADRASLNHRPGPEREWFWFSWRAKERAKTLGDPLSAFDGRLGGDPRSERRNCRNGSGQMVRASDQVRRNRRPPTPVASYTLVSVVWISKVGLEWSRYVRAAFHHPGRRSGPAWRSDNWRGMILQVLLSGSPAPTAPRSVPPPRQTLGNQDLD